MSKVKEIAERLERENAKTAATVNGCWASKGTILQRLKPFCCKRPLPVPARRGDGRRGAAVRFPGLGWPTDPARAPPLPERPPIATGSRNGGDRKAAAERLAAARAVADTEGARLRAELERVTAEIGGQLELIDNEVSEAVRVYEQYDRTILQFRRHPGTHPPVRGFKGNEPRERYLAEIQKFKRIAARRISFPAATNLTSTLTTIFRSPNRRRDRPKLRAAVPRCRGLFNSGAVARLC